MADADLWTELNRVRINLAKHAERSDNRDKKIADLENEIGEINKKVDQLLTMVAQARAVAGVSGMIGRSLWTGGGVIAGLVIANWQAIKKIF